MLFYSHAQYHNATLHKSDPGRNNINKTEIMNEGNACRYINPEINKEVVFNC